MTLIRRHRRLHYFLRNLCFAPVEWQKALEARRRCTGRTLPIVMIVGCSRSGTSFAARMLASAGLLFPGEYTAPDEFNPLGYFEAERVVAINSDLLWGSGGHWFAPPAKLRVHAYQRARIVQALSWLCSCDSVSGWKDPRGTLTLSVWLAAARALNIPVQVVGVFRDPVAVATSIIRHERGGIAFDQALRAWYVHNNKLLELAEALPDRFSWFTMDQPPPEVEANLNSVAARIGLPGRVQVDRARRGDTTCENASVGPRPTNRMYHRLLAAHAAQWDSVYPRTLRSVAS